MAGFIDNPDPCTLTNVSVTIEAVTPASVTFTTRSSGRMDERLLRTFTVPLAEICNVPLKDEPPPVELEPGATGELFMTRKGWAAKSADGFGIFGADTALFKKPECAGMTPRWLSRLTIVPTSVVLRGHLQGKTAFFDIELLGDRAAHSQVIAWNGATYINLRLTEAGAEAVGLDVRDCDEHGLVTASVWPVAIKIKGSPLIDPTVSGELDLLDSQMIEGPQHIELAKGGVPITLTVTQDGCNAFHVTPQIVAELSRSGAQIGAPCRGCSEQSRARTRERASRVARRRAPR